MVRLQWTTEYCIHYDYNFAHETWIARNIIILLHSTNIVLKYRAHTTYDSWQSPSTVDLF